MVGKPGAAYFSEVATVDSNGLNYEIPFVFIKQKHSRTPISFFVVVTSAHESP